MRILILYLFECVYVCVSESGKTQMNAKKLTFLHSFQSLLIPTDIRESCKASSLKPPEAKQTHLSLFFFLKSSQHPVLVLSATGCAVNRFLRPRKLEACSMGLRVSFFFFFLFFFFFTFFLPVELIGMACSARLQRRDHRFGKNEAGYERIELAATKRWMFRQAQLHPFDGWGQLGESKQLSTASGTAYSCVV